MRILRFMVWFVLLFCIIGGSALAKGRAVSLSVLQGVLKKGESQEARRLCGITRVSGYIIDAKTKDVILVGEVEPGKPKLELDDFVVALRNALLMYARTEGRTRYYSAPGCSIDPSPLVIGELQRITDLIPECREQEELDRVFEEWHAVGRLPQKVRVMGVPFDSRFAKVMVDADFYMKRLVNGSVSLEIEGFTSLSDLTIADVKNRLNAGKSGWDAGMSLNRFWFSPGDVTYSEEDGIVLLRSCPVILLTEEEFLTQQGSVAGYGRPNALARKFAESFSVHYSQIAAQRPVYTELEDLFRFAALTKLISDEKMSSNLGFLLNKYRVKTVPVSRMVSGLTSVKQIEMNARSGNSVYKSTLFFPSCGGVSMNVKPRKIRTSRNAAPVVSKPSVNVSRPSRPVTKSVSAKPTAATAKPAGVKKAVLDARKSVDSMSWDFELPGGK